MLPLINAADELLIMLVAAVKNIPGKIKHMSDSTQSTMFAPAFKEGAFIKTKIKFKTPNTTAKYNKNTDNISISEAVPKLSVKARLIIDPQLMVRNLFNVKSSKVKLCCDLLKKGRVIE